MNAQDTAAALASALPGGITYILGGGRDDWTAAKIAEFQAERLTETGYVLLHGEYIDDETVERVAKTLHRCLYYGSTLEPYMPHDDVWQNLTEDKRIPFLRDARRALAAFAQRGR